MSDLKKLAKRLMTLDDRIIACMKCGMCQAVCPMFGATMMEADVARGKLALVDNLAHEMIADPDAVAAAVREAVLAARRDGPLPRAEDPTRTTDAVARAHRDSYREVLGW